MAKVFAEGIFYLCLSILFFTFERCVNVFKNIPAKFQSRPTFLAGFFSKRVTDDDDRRKTFLLASCSEYRSLNYRVVTMEYRTSDRAMRMQHVRTPRAFFSCRPANSLNISLCFLSFELLCLTM